VLALHPIVRAIILFSELGDALDTDTATRGSRYFLVYTFKTRWSAIDSSRPIPSRSLFFTYLLVLHEQGTLKSYSIANSITDPLVVLILLSQYISVPYGTLWFLSFLKPSDGTNL